jgi:hypothetical protein
MWAPGVTVHNGDVLTDAAAQIFGYLGGAILAACLIPQVRWRKACRLIHIDAASLPCPAAALGCVGHAIALPVHIDS